MMTNGGLGLSSFHEQKAIIAFMNPQADNKFRWPRKQQVEDVPLCEVLAVLKSPPQPVNQFGLFPFDDCEANQITKLMYCTQLLLVAEGTDR